MAQSVDILDPCSSPEWLKMVQSHQHAGIFHHPQWLTMLRETYGYEVFAVCVREAGNITAAVPFADIKSPLTGRRWVSLPFSDHCRPLVHTGDPEALESLVEFLWRKQSEGIPKIEVRWNVETSQPVFHDAAFVLHTLDLRDGYEVLAGRFEKQTLRRSIQKASKSGVLVREGTSENDLDIFYALQVNTRKRLGVPAQPRGFFEAVWHHMMQSGLGFLLIAEKEGKPLAANMYFRFGTTVYYKYGASDFRYKEFRPSHAVMNEAIRKACAEGAMLFDFGRSDRDGEGLRRFKSGWGSTEAPLVYTRLGGHPVTNGRSGIKQLVGNVIKHTPEFVCRMSGRLLYKHFA